MPMQPVDEYYPDEQAAQQLRDEEAAIEALRADSPPIHPTDAFLGDDAPAPGLYQGVPEDAYHALDACSNSRLTLLQRSPAHAKEAIESPTPSTKAQRIGTAAHWAILEPEVFDQRVDAAGQCEATTGKGTRCSYGGKVRVGGQWFCGTHAPDADPDELFVISEEGRDGILAMRDAVHDHPTAGALVSMPGLCEATAVFDVRAEDVTGGVAISDAGADSFPLRCKARLDYWGRETGTLVDLKTTRNAEPDEFQRAIWNYGYFRQLAFYRHALQALGRDVDEALIIAVEKDPPYAVAVYRLSAEALKAGWRQLEDLLARYAWCEHTGDWPAYSDDVEEISLPRWAWDRL